MHGMNGDVIDQKTTRLFSEDDHAAKGFLYLQHPYIMPR